MYPQAIEESKINGQLSGDPHASEFALALERGFHFRGWNGALINGIETAKVQYKSGIWSAYDLADLYAQLGDKEQAFQSQHCLSGAHSRLISLKTTPSFDLIRSDPRFAELVRKVGLPQ